MKGNFETCLAMLLEHEGGFVNHPDDPGGVTNLGVTLATYEQYLDRSVTITEMKALTPEDVGPVYKKNYWDRLKGDLLPPGIDWMLFDWGVNSGTGRAAKAIQRIIGVKQDGGIGPITLSHIEEWEPEKIIDQLHYNRQKFYESLNTFETFGNGWTRRNNETHEQALAML